MAASRRRPRSSTRRGGVPALGLPPVVALLERRGRTSRPASVRPRTERLPPGGDRLPQHLLRPAGAGGTERARAAAITPRRSRAAGDAASRDRSRPSARVADADRAGPATARRSTSCSTRSGSGATRRRCTATIALVQNRLGNLRLGINAMKRAYPQWMAAGGESLPDRDSARHLPARLLAAAAEARARRAASIRSWWPRWSAQESTFDPVIRSLGQRRRADAGAAVHRPRSSRAG